MISLPFGPGYGDHYYSSFFNRRHDSLPNLICVGWEIKTSSEYSWSGLNRGGPIGMLQYTLSGKGMLEHAGERYELTSGKAFILEVPDDHRYYLPADSESWEFIFITFNGNDIIRQLHLIAEEHGPVIDFTIEHPVIQLCEEICRKVYLQEFSCAEDSAEWLYRLMMTIRKTMLPGVLITHSGIKQAIHYINQHISDEISIADLAKIAKISQTHFFRLFKDDTGYSPGQYINQIRLKHALFYLRHTLLPLQEISLRCGFQDGSYFGKVFHKLTGMTPGYYRNNVHELSEIII